MGFDYNTSGALARPFNNNADTDRAQPSAWQRLLSLRSAEKTAAADRPVSRFIDLVNFTFVQSLLPAPVRGLAASRFYTPAAPVVKPAPEPEVAVILTLKGKTDVFKRTGTSVIVEVPTSVARFSAAARLKAKTEVFKRNGASVVVQMPSAASPFMQAAAPAPKAEEPKVAEAPVVVAEIKTEEKPRKTLSLGRAVDLPPPQKAAAVISVADVQKPRKTLSLGARVDKAELPSFESLSSRSSVEAFAAAFKAQVKLVETVGIEEAARPVTQFSVAQKSRKSWNELMVEAEAAAPKKTHIQIDLNAAFRREMQSVLAREGAEAPATAPVARPAAPRAAGMAA